MTVKDNLCEMPFVWLAARCARLGDSATDNAVQAKAQQFAEEWAGLVIRQMPLPDYKIAMN
jgi:hypothetical protein